jgi:hypothetical protein
MMRRRPHLPFRADRARAWWLLLVACAAAGVWAVAQVLAWPIPARAALAAAAAVVALIVPELRERRAAAQRQEQLLTRVEVRGGGGQLPAVLEVTDTQLRVHAAQLNARPRKRLAWRTPAEALDQPLCDPHEQPGVALTG